MSERSDLALPQSGYDVLSMIVKGYLEAGALDSEVTLEKIMRSTALTGSMISRNHKFLSSIGILERVGKYYKLTRDGKEQALAFQYEDSASVREIWRRLIVGNDVLRGIVSAVRVRGEMSEEALQQHIGMVLEAPRSKKNLTGIRTLISILVEAEALKDIGGNFRVSPEFDMRVRDEERPSESENERKGPTQEAPSEGEKQGEKKHAGIVLNVSVSVALSADSTDEDIRDIAEKVRQLQKHLSEATAE